ncbi:hypothetical protein [Actinomadura sp. 9N215]|uniref:hypothetical protein n=1 Tax=Actinomadura sp. 9N215 TaxID=3375150 RepID=UPI0037B37AA9
MAWQPDHPETDWTPASDALLADLAYPLHHAWPCPSAPPRTGPTDTNGVMVGNQNGAWASM